MEQLKEFEQAVLLNLSKRFAGIKGKALGKFLFEICSSLVPSVNVDVLVRDSQGRFFLTWREDEFYGPGWHIPGGVIRHKETMHDRVIEVLRNECHLEAQVEVMPAPTIIREIFNNDRCVRGHFISMLFVVDLNAVGSHEFDGAEDCRFFQSVPENLIPQHRILYGEYLSDLSNSPTNSA